MESALHRMGRCRRRLRRAVIPQHPSRSQRLFVVRCWLWTVGPSKWRSDPKNMSADSKLYRNCPFLCRQRKWSLHSRMRRVACQGNRIPRYSTRHNSANTRFVASRLVDRLLLVHMPRVAIGIIQGQGRGDCAWQVESQTPGRSRCRLAVGVCFRKRLLWLRRGC